VTYKEQLAQPEWKKRRCEILKRDRSKCQECSNIEYFKIFDFTQLRIDRNKRVYGVLKTEDLAKGESLIDQIKIYSTLSLRDLSSYQLGEGEQLIAFYAKDKLKNIGNYVATGFEGIIKYLPKFSKDDINGVAADYKATMIPIIKESIGEKCADLPSELVDMYLEYLLHEYCLLKAELSLMKKQFETIGSESIKDVDWITATNLHVHHHYYIKNRKAWEYPDEALITYCGKCHHNIHQIIKIPMYDNSGQQLYNLTPCSRCEGTGVLPEYHYYQDGICFQCGGARFNEWIDV
jgi:hypothetical protein